MNTKYEGRKQFLMNFSFFALLTGLYFLFVKYALVYVVPFVIAAFLAVGLQKPVRFLTKKLKLHRHNFVSFFLVFVICAILGVVLTLCGILLANELKSFMSYLGTRMGNLPAYLLSIKQWLISFLTVLPDGVEGIVTNSLNDFWDEYLTFNSTSETPGGAFDFSVLSGPLAGAWNTAKRIPSILLTLLVTVISCFFMTADYKKISDLILGFFSPATQKNLVNVKQTFFSAFGKMAKAYILIIVITFVEMFLGLNLLKLFGIYDGGYSLIIALVTAIVDIIPVLGTGTILIPWALICFFTGNIGMGIGLIVIYAVISVLRQIIEPKLVAGQVGLPPIFTIMAMYVGAKVFGVFGIIILPLTVISLKLMYDEGVFAAFGKSDEEAELEQSEELKERSESVSVEASEKTGEE